MWPSCTWRRMLGPTMRSPIESAVFLAPGDATEDGWLQPREIAALDLRGRLVVLSACESAGGSVLSGEGPLSLARAFFAGGAGAVVATRWPLRDDDAALIMGRFYEALGAGEGAASALRLARLDAIERGLPAAAWAGVVLLGDGRRAPLVPGPTSPALLDGRPTVGDRRRDHLRCRHGARRSPGIPTTPVRDSTAPLRSSRSSGFRNGAAERRRDR